DILEAARALDPASNQQIGNPHRTSTILNTHNTPTILALLGKDDPDLATLEQFIKEHTRSDRFFAADISEISERFFGTKLFANIVMLGIAFQRGFLPLSLKSLEWAINSGLGTNAAMNLKAFTLGRHMAHDMASVLRVMGTSPAPDGYETVLKECTELLSRTRFGGKKLAKAYFQMVERASEHLRLSNKLLADFARRVYDLVQFDGLEYARQYVDLVRQVHTWDTERHGYTATRAVIRNLHKTMLIKDELYVAHLLTSEEKHRRDRARFNVDPSRGDRIVYRHFTRPQITVLGATVSWNMVARDWMLNIFKHMRWLRRFLPRWHQREREFRDWYIGLLPGFKDAAANDDAYQLYARVLELPTRVSGYREVRYPKMAAVQNEAAEILAKLSKQAGMCFFSHLGN
ncbi:MAG: 2-oxoacid:acceptor oxidoreductase family protein, partial [Verrucomicrobiae bacterium]|nr:2-oxoacid:acceptor oxidoreductase family protein [Verrucomicrobiae bacterium]